MDGYFVAFATALYLIASALIFQQALKRQHIHSTVYAILTFGCVAHFGVVYTSIIGTDGQNMSITNVLALVSWLTTLTILISTRFMPNTLLLPGVALFSGLSVLAVGIIPDHYMVTINISGGLIVHITLSLMSYTCLCIAFLYALQMTLIRTRLKQKDKVLIGGALPPLMLVESLLFKLTLLGALLLFIALLSGFVFVDNMLSSQYAHKTVLSLLALVIYVLLLVGQKQWGWRNKQVVTLTTVGLSFLTLSYFGSRFVREVLL